MGTLNRNGLWPDWTGKVTLVETLQKIGSYAGVRITRWSDGLPADLDDFSRSTILEVADFTMTSPERIATLVEAVRYVSVHQIPGAIVECGVWRGGSMMAVAKTLESRKEKSLRDLFLFDTFEGMSQPSSLDRDMSGVPAEELLSSAQKKERSIWAIAGLQDVQANLAGTGYPLERLHYIRGKVEDTIPKYAPDQIALLRLDTDWYESTRHELEHLMPRMESGSVLIVDDYGHWQGARKAVDEYLLETGLRMFLTRIDYTGRVGIVQ